MRRIRAVLIVLALLAPAASAEATVRNHRVDAGHTGELAEAKLTAPIGRKWIRRDLSAVGEPLVADGRAFLVASASAPAVMALERDTGRTLWERAGLASGFAYADGVLFYTAARALQAVDAATGALRWRVELHTEDTGIPTYDGGTVYVGAEGGVVAVRASDGFQLWGSGASGASEGALGVDPERVYAVSGCAETTALERRLGLQMWRYVGDCTGGGGGTPMVADGLVYASGSFSGEGVILDASSGAERGSFDGVPTRAGDHVLLTRRGELAAQDREGRIVWRVEREDDASLPLVVGGIAWVRQETSLAGYDVRTGALVQRTGAVTEDYSESSGGTIGTDGEWLVAAGYRRVVGLAAGPDTVDVDAPDLPQGSETRLTLRVERRVVRPSAPRVELEVDAERNGLSVSDRIELEADPYPFDDRWEHAGTFEAGRAIVVPAVNTRYRAVDVATAPHVVSAPVELRVEFDSALTLRALSRRTLLATARMATPPGLAMAGRRVYFYRLRRGQRLARRIRVARWRATPQPDRYRAAIRIRIRGLRRTDRIFFCFRNPLPNAVGPPVRGPDPCGRRRA